MKVGIARPVSVLRHILIVAAVSLTPGLTASHAAGLNEYLLGPQDKVRLKVYEWRASRDVIFEWNALNDQFTVGADGSLFLPFVGEIHAEGEAPGDLARAIGDRLMHQMGLGRQPDVAVEVVQFRPFYILGHVEQPGEFPYRPGLTVLQALSIAGGLRTRADGIDRMERELIAGRGDIGLIALSNVSLSVRKARLETELADADEIQFPDELTNRSGDPSVALLMEQERLIFNARREGLDTQIRALEGLRSFLEKELESLGGHVALYDTQIGLLEKELSGVTTLVDKGLAVAPRVMALERGLAQLQSDRLAAETSLLRARQEISRTDIAIIELRNQHIKDITVTLRDTQTQMNELARKADTAIQMLHDSEMTAPRLLALRDRSARAEPVYTITRRTGEGLVELPASEATPVQAGDAIKVELPLPPIGGEDLLPRSSFTALPAAASALAPAEAASTN